MVLTVHGDDFTVSGSTANLQRMKREFERRFEVTAHTLGPEVGQEREVRILNGVIRWTPEGLEYEPDQRHAEIAICELGLEGARAVTIPGTKEELALAGVPEAASKSSSVPVELLMPPAEATRYRGIAARLNFVAQDRVNLQYACKEASRRMARPQLTDWAILKRIGRYLVGCPRYVQKLPWQSAPASLDTYTDSDWAGCKATCRSTSGCGPARRQLSLSSSQRRSSTP